MSTIAVAPGFGSTRRPTVRPADRRDTAVSPPAPARLTRRGRVVLLVAFVAIVFAVLTVLGDQSAATGERGAPVETRMVEVAEGQTLWEIAAEVAEPGEIRATVHQIQELNAMPSVALAVGQRIAVPVD